MEVYVVLRLILYFLLNFTVICGRRNHRGAKNYRIETKVEDPGNTLVKYRMDRELVVTTILIEPYTMLRKSNISTTFWQPNHHPSYQMYEGYIVDLMDHLSQSIGFRYRLVPVSDGQFGFSGPDGNWNGMIGELVNGKADMAAGPMFITDQRQKVVDFTRPFITVGATILFRKPPEGIPPEIDVAADLVDNPYIDFGTLNRGIIRRAFRYSNNSLHREMWNHMKTYQQYLLTETNEEGIERVRKENYAFILPTTIAEYIVRRRPCDLMVIDNFLMREGFGLGVPRGSALLPYLNEALESLERSGALKKIYDKWWIGRGECNPVSEGRVLSLSGSAYTFHPVVLLYCLHLFIFVYITIMYHNGS